MAILAAHRRALGAALTLASLLASVRAFAQATPKDDSKKKEEEAPAAATDEKREEEKKEDDKPKGDETKPGDKEVLDTSVEAKKAIYISGDIGFTRSDLGLISDSLGFDQSGANGVLYGLAAGLRMKDVRIGARWRVDDTTEFTLWSIALSAGYGLPMRPISPIVSVHVGYVFDQKMQTGLFRSSLPVGNVLPPDVDVRGLIAGVDLNASYWVTPFLRLGLFIGADALVLHRPRVAHPQSLFGPTPELNSNPLYADSGTGVGLNLNAGLRGAFDIGLK